MKRLQLLLICLFLVAALLLALVHRVRGQTPHAQSGIFQMQGRRADGSPLASHVLLAVKGTQVIQVTVLGSTLEDTAVDTFLQSVRLLP